MAWCPASSPLSLFCLQQRSWLSHMYNNVYFLVIKSGLHCAECHEWLVSYVYWFQPALNPNFFEPNSPSTWPISCSGWHVAVHPMNFLPGYPPAGKRCLMIWWLHSPVLPPPLHTIPFTLPGRNHLSADLSMASAVIWMVLIRKGLSIATRSATCKQTKTVPVTIITPLIAMMMMMWWWWWWSWSWWWWWFAKPLAGLKRLASFGARGGYWCTIFPRLVQTWCKGGSGPFFVHRYPVPGTRNVVLENPFFGVRLKSAPFLRPKRIPKTEKKGVP